MDSRKLIFYILGSSLMVFLAPSLSSAYQGDGIAEPGENRAEDLRRAAQNPMADLISFPIQKPTANAGWFFDQSKVVFRISRPNTNHELS